VHSVPSFGEGETRKPAAAAGVVDDWMERKVRECGGGCGQGGAN
jgi:hypothetical protein